MRSCSAESAAARRVHRHRYPDLSGMTVGTWRILYEEKGEENPHCLCRCVRCGVKKVIAARKFLDGYALRCPECRFREKLEEA
ncbi:MAG: hypothetical protein HZB86_08875 [Deltaproteobacteria bacterium]|nr:hypothetical protein [Deltaproteobacteria bacterium]